ncbi:hypothetical protein P170DRAFT_363814 [Aspergillus steynii IBT 23096]|uniref:Beta-xylosidase C-terminal Concanavalin A-like domain-containing protein n=1 Tax=Aspergillus steynii IBT 23096 TaxID=1392250 RepID=A0A2I2FZX0_9EURO|nr:uncharacterized protein P170DRAFT_363814 [Aspergillus steynii IBT 23096]PLB46171.1 hypothetical protein P170DRAFT_363814 [Aspergillus steynii IBT 23096]
MACRNPIIPGFAPDPSIVRIQDTFYLVNSSFHLYPGLPIFASKDLIDWTHIGNAIHRPTQLSLARSCTNLIFSSDDSIEKAPVTGGLYAPTIRHHDGTTYIICTNVVYNEAEDTGDWASGLSFQSFIISTTDIRAGQWSDPIFFDYHGIDPDLFFDDDGRAYISGSSWRPSPSCGISCFEIEIDTGRKLSEETMLWYGHTQIIPEGPHIYKRGGYYYLLVAEGGTHEGHCITIARASSIWGPYESCDRNPILQSTGMHDPFAYCHYNGHGDLVQDLQGDWWMVCLGVRKDRAGRMILGRETFLAAVKWPAGEIWPQIEHPIPRAMYRRLEGGNAEGDSGCSTMSSPMEMIPSPLSPDMDLVWIRDPDFSRSWISTDGRLVCLLASPTDLGECTGQSMSFIGRRQRRLAGSASAALVLSQESDTEGAVDAKLGLAYYKDEHRYAMIMYEPGVRTVAFEVLNRAKDPQVWREKRVEVNCEDAKTITFRIVYTEQLIYFLYRLGSTADREGWNPCVLVDTLDLSGHDFTGPVIGVFATGLGEEWNRFEEVDI